MPTKQDIENLVMAFLIHDRLFLLNKLAPTILTKQDLLASEDSAFHEEIKREFETLIRREIAEEIAKTVQIDPEQVFLIVETLDVNEFIGNFIPPEVEEYE